MRNNNKLTILMAVALALFLGFTPYCNASAAKVPTWPGGSTITINRQIKKAYGTVSNTFDYAISAASDNPSGAMGVPAAPSIAFDEKLTSQQSITKGATVDFSAMQFDAIGDYSYIITEENSSNATLYPVDKNNSYTVIISVRNNESASGYAASLYVQDAAGDKLKTLSGDNSELIFASAPAYTNIQITGSVSNNGSSTDLNKCFEYRLTFETTDSYAIDTKSTCENPSTISSNGIIRLKHGDTMLIGFTSDGSQIPVGIKYSITKVGTSGSAATNIDDVERATINKTTVPIDSPEYNIANKTSIVEIINKPVDTGAILNTSIYVLLAFVGVGGIFYATHKKSAKKE